MKLPPKNNVIMNTVHVIVIMALLSQQVYGDYFSWEKNDISNSSLAPQSNVEKVLRSSDHPFIESSLINAKLFFQKKIEILLIVQEK